MGKAGDTMKRVGAGIGAGFASVAGVAGAMPTQNNHSQMQNYSGPAIIKSVPAPRTPQEIIKDIGKTTNNAFGAVSDARTKAAESKTATKGAQSAIQKTSAKTTTAPSTATASKTNSALKGNSGSAAKGASASSGGKSSSGSSAGASKGGGQSR
jgi:hypothetical protein